MSANDEKLHCNANAYAMLESLFPIKINKFSPFYQKHCHDFALFGGRPRNRRNDCKPSGPSRSTYAGGRMVN